MTLTSPNQPPTLSEQARARMTDESASSKPLFLGDWADPAFIHFEVNPAKLQPHVPYPLDTRDGKAYLSLVAFRMGNLRFARGGCWTRWMTKLIANHLFLNLRTYVIKDDEPGIHFVCEWLNSRLATLLGPLTFGLPYRFANINYQINRKDNCFDGLVKSAGKAVKFRLQANPQVDWQPAAQGSRTEHLLERYTAFNARWKWRGLFRVWHRPWPQKHTDQITIEDLSLLKTAPGALDWLPTLNLVGGNLSTGAKEVWMGRPRTIKKNT